LLPDVFVLAPDSLGDDASVLLGVASGSDGEDEDAFVPIALAGAGNGASEDGIGAAGTVNERLGLFVPITAEASVADEREAASFTLGESLPRFGAFMSPAGGMSPPGLVRDVC
jgi:hypothetical protein